MPNKGPNAPTLLSVDEALARIIDGLAQKAPETISSESAHGRVLATPLHATLTLPAQDVSAMDGYAVRASDCGDVPVTLKRVGESAAGHPWSGSVGSGEAVRIFTGAVVPDKADTIVLQEDVVADSEQDGANIIINEAPKPAQFIRPAGLDIKTGALVLEAGRPLSARALALALATGNHNATVLARPRVGVLSTGDELVPPGSIPAAGQIISSNAAYLRAFVSACGGEAVDLGIARDQAGAMAAAVRGATAKLDLVVTTGGASVGVYDHVASDLAANGNMLNFWKIAMRPGKPLIFGHVDGTPLIGLPGNPVSCAVCALVFLHPAVVHLAGGHHEPSIFSARLALALPENDQRQDYLRAQITPCDSGLPLITPATKQDSSMISVLSNATALIVRPPFDSAKSAGDIVRAMPISPLL
jgi:molybdopterin molybdotransferase